jgi:alpha-glucosidase
MELSEKPNQNLPLSAGQLKTWKQSASILKVQAENAVIELSFFEADIILVEAELGTKINRIPSYAVEKLPVVNKDILTQQSEEELTAQTPNIRAVISNKNCGIRFETDAGAILADDPGLGSLWFGGGFTVHKILDSEARFYGLGEKSGPINKRGKYFINANTDHFGYGVHSDPLYASIPFFISSTGNQWYGIFLDNTAYSFFDFGTSQERYFAFGSNAGPLRYYFISGIDPLDVLAKYNRLTGMAPMPPKWALGYQQCRYSYYPDDSIIHMLDQFDQKSIPIDVIYLDIHYMDKYRVFTWHPEYFKDPKDFIQKCSDRGIAITVILDPGIAKDEGYHAYNEGTKADLWVKYLDGNAVEGNVWPGLCVFPDFTNSDCRAWWAGKIQELSDMGIKGFWTDMNEPALWGNRFPESAVFDYDGNTRTFLEARNIYGMQMSKATAAGVDLKSLKNNKRKFLLTRAAFSGAQRYTAIWTGDNSSSEEHYRLSATMISNLSISGFPMCGADIGGFIGESTPQLYVRWIALGAMQPLFRSHTMINSRPAEPWGFGEEAEQISRQYIQFRYRLIPYWLSLFYSYTQTGKPPILPIAFAYFDLKLAQSNQYEDHFLVGDQFLVCPGNLSQSYSAIFLPGTNNWFDLYSGMQWPSGEHIWKENPQRVPIFIREGSMFVMWPKAPNRANEQLDVIELHLFGLKHNTSFVWYDDNDTINADKKLQIQFQYDYLSGQLSWKIIHNNLQTDIKWIKLCIHGELNTISMQRKNTICSFSRENYLFFKALDPFDPYNPDALQHETLFGTQALSIEFPTYDDFIEFVYI